MVNNISKDYPTDEWYPIHIAQFIGYTTERSQCLLLIFITFIE